VDNKANPKQFILRILSKNYKTESEIRSILYKKFGLSDNEISKIIDEIKSMGLINDEYFTKSFIDSRINKGYGSRYIKSRLKRKGIEIQDKIDPNIDKVVEIVKRRYNREIESNDTTQKKKTISKIYNFLAYRGFTISEIKDIMRKL
jgi:regulatory protein